MTMPDFSVFTPLGPSATREDHLLYLVHLLSELRGRTLVLLDDRDAYPSEEEIRHLYTIEKLDAFRRLHVALVKSETAAEARALFVEFLRDTPTYDLGSP